MALHLSIPISNTSLTQQGVACYVIKLNSKSFRVRSNFGVAFAQAASKSRGKGRANPWQIFLTW